MNKRYISFKNKENGRRETFNKAVEIYKKYTREELGITYNALMNALSKNKKYENENFVIAYKERVKTEWKKARDMKFDEYLKLEKMKHYRKKPRQPERELQEACVRWFRLQYPKLVIFAVPNGGSRNLYEARNMKESGTLAGVADLVIVGNGGKVLFVEMKAGRNKQGDNQILFQKNVERLGHKYVICRSIEGFKKEVDLWV